jgi:hypothetical protein
MLTEVTSIIRCLICVMSSGSVICTMWIGKIVTRAVHCPFQFIILKYIWAAWKNQGKLWRSDLSNTNYERQHFYCCRSMGSWESRWGTEDKENKTCAICINCTHWLFAGHGFDNGFLKVLKYMWVKNLPEFEQFKYTYKFGRWVTQWSRLLAASNAKQFLHFHCYKIGDPLASTVT